MKKKINITRNDVDVVTTNTTPGVFTDPKRPWAMAVETETDDFVVLRDGTVSRRSDAIASDSAPWDTRR